MSLTLGFVGNFQVPYSTESDRKWSFEKLGHKVMTFQENETSYVDLEKSIDQLDALFYSHTHGWEIPGLEKIFRLCKGRGIPTASAHLDRWAWLDREKDVGKEATWHTEFIFMADGSPEAVELYEKYHLNWHWLKPGVVERDCYMAKPDRDRFPHDIVFVGSKGYHPEYEFRPKLVDWLAETYGDRFGHYGNDGLGTIRGKDLNTLYASAKVVVGDSCFGGRPRYTSDRVTETLGRGGYLIHPFVDNFEEDFGLQFGTHLTGWERDDLDKTVFSLKSRIDEQLEIGVTGERCRAVGHEEVKDHHTYTHRAKEMLEVMGL